MVGKSSLSSGSSNSNNFGGVSKQIVSPNFYNWVMPYVNDSDLEELIEADNDDGKKLAILDNIFDRAGLPDSFTSDIYRNERMELIKRLDHVAMETHGDLINEKMLSKMKISKPSRVTSKPSSVKTKVNIKITQKSSSGKTYTRNYNKWSKSEEMYLKVRIEKLNSGQESFDKVTVNLHRLSGVNRSNSSIKAKLRRLESARK